MNQLDKTLLAQIADLHKMPEGAYNIRKNGESVARSSTAEIDIIKKTDKSGIDIHVKANTKGKSVHIPVIITHGGLEECVYNDFFVGKGADITIVAGCGIHNDQSANSQHDGIHTFYLEEGAKVRYIERHIGTGKGAQKIMHPTTVLHLKKGAQFEMETNQIGGVTMSNRKTKATLAKDAKLIVKEKVLTEDSQTTTTRFDVSLNGKNASAEILSRSVAKGSSVQTFVSNLKGKNECFGHVECDGILLDHARIASLPKVDALVPEATLVHEAAIGKIAGEQLVKLMTLGLTKEQAEQVIIEGYLS